LVIGTSGVQYAVRGPTSRVVAHVACYLVWRQESEATRLRGER
jgi:hypothetical protein